jgi:hypothetical protein
VKNSLGDISKKSKLEIAGSKFPAPLRSDGLIPLKWRFLGFSFGFNFAEILKCI